MSNRIDRAEKITGWMRRAELAWLENAATAANLVIEFGSFLGRSSVALAAAKNLICVDRWVVAEQEKSNNVFTVGADILAEFLQNLAPDADHVTAVRCNLKKPAEREKLIQTYSQLADLVFIDASHDYADVKEDIYAALLICKPGGIVCGHDYSGAWPGVVSAVNELLPTAAPTGAGTIWATRLPAVKVLK